MTGSVVPPTTISDEAVRAAAKALHRDRYGWNAPHAGVLESVHRASAEHDAHVVVAAVLPVIEAGLREQISDEIEAAGAAIDGFRGADIKRQYGIDGIYRMAARVARGTQETTNG